MNGLVLAFELLVEGGDVLVVPLAVACALAVDTQLHQRLRRAPHPGSGYPDWSGPRRPPARAAWPPRPGGPPRPARPPACYEFRTRFPTLGHLVFLPPHVQARPVGRRRRGRLPPRVPRERRISDWRGMGALNWRALSGVDEDLDRARGPLVVRGRRRRRRCAPAGSGGSAGGSARTRPAARRSRAIWYSERPFQDE